MVCRRGRSQQHGAFGLVGGEDIDISQRVRRKRAGRRRVENRLRARGSGDPQRPRPAVSRGVSNWQRTQSPRRRSARRPAHVARRQARVRRGGDDDGIPAVGKHVINAEPLAPGACADARHVHARCAQAVEQEASGGVGADLADHPDRGAQTRGGGGLVGAFSARIDGKIASGKRFADPRDALDGNRVVRVETADDVDHAHRNSRGR